MPVREVDPNRLLLMSGPAGHLQPYLRRDADADLDRALATPGVVLVLSPSFSGARRSTYEALLRNLPDEMLACYDPGTLDDEQATVLWADFHPHLSWDLSKELTRALGWQRRREGRWLLILVREDEYAQEGLEPLRTSGARIVRFQSALSANERSALGEHGLDSSVSTVSGVFYRGELFPSFPDANGIGSGADPGTAGAGPHEGHAGNEAGYHPDTDTGDDHLDITADVNMLADLVASRRVEPPLSIGLFGDWGSGKSFFMRRMRARIRELGQATAEAERTAGERGSSVSAYCSQIRQVTFNAWHYAESNLWASLAAHLLDNLASGGPEDDLERHADDLAERRRHQSSALDQLSSVRVERMLLTAHLERQQRRAPAPRATARALAKVLAAEDWATAGSGPPGETAKQVSEFLAEATGVSAELRNLWRRVRRSRAALVVAAIGSAAAVTAIAFASSPLWPAVIAGLTAALAMLPALRAVRSSVVRIRRAGEELQAESESPARARLAELDAEEARLEEAVADLARSQDLTAFARFRDESRDYRRHLGVVSLVRRDLETIAAMLACGPDDDRGPGPERIVLYIDDLDRCRPDAVVKVLEAVHLLLAQPVFTIVVAAEPNWLLSSIDEHYGTVLDGERPPGDGARKYLEKIFQVTFTLAPMSGRGFTSLVTGLLRERGEEAGPDAASSRPAVGPVRRRPEPAPGVPSTPEELAAPAATDHSPRVSRLRPRQLEITDDELRFIANLAPLVPSPRAAKRLVNLYRLFRARLTAEELDGFLEEPETGYRAALVLLALTVGPWDPSTFFDQVENNLPTVNARVDHWPWNLVADTPRRAASYRRWLPLIRRFSFTAG